MQILKKKNIILSLILFCALVALVSCGSSSSKDETFYTIAACEEKTPTRFFQNTEAEIPVSLSALEDGTYAMYQSEFRVETKMNDHPALFQIWEKVVKQASAVAGAPSYNIQNDWGCVSASEAIKEKTSFVAQADVLRIFKKSNGQVEWINRRLGVQSNHGVVSRFYNDPVKVVGRETNGAERSEIEILKTSFSEFERRISHSWDKFTFSNVVARAYEFHGMKRVDANTMIYVRTVYEKQKNPAADVSSDLFIPIPTVDALH